MINSIEENMEMIIMIMNKEVIIECLLREEFKWTCQHSSASNHVNC